MLRLLAILALVLLPAAVLAQTDAAVLLDGSRIGQNIKGITAEGKVEFDADAKPVDLQGLRRIERTLERTTSAATARVHLLGGGTIRASAVTLHDDTCHITWAYGQMKLPIAAVRGIRLNDEADVKKLPAGADTFDADLNTPPTDKDRLFAIVENKIQSLPGIFVALSADKLKFSFEGTERELDRPKAFGLTLAGGGKSPQLSGLALVQLVDGSSVWAKIDTMTSGMTTLKLPSGLDVKLPWAAVARLDVRSDRLVFISDLDPTDVYEKSIATVGSWQRDRSVRGKTLSIKGKTFDKGIGVHATNRLTYNVDPKFTIFAATIGIDDMTKGKGDCEFVILADGKELLRQRVRGSEAAAEIRVKLEGAKKITLAVEAGEDLDFADHGNWGDARLIRE